MPWSQVKEEFLDSLNLERSKVLRHKAAVRNLPVRSNRLNIFLDQNAPLEECKRRLEQLEKAQLFLSNLDEISECCPNIEEQFLIDFSKAIQKALKTPGSNYQELSGYVMQLTQKIGLVDGPNKQVAEKNKATNQGNCIGALVTGSLSAILVAVALTSGPFGMLAVAAVGLLVSLIVAAVAGYRLHKNNQFIENTQFNEIAAFVKEFAPNPKKADLQPMVGIEENDPEYGHVFYEYPS